MENSELFEPWKKWYPNDKIYVETIMGSEQWSKGQVKVM